jgi:hypothetical protein
MHGSGEVQTGLILQNCLAQVKYQYGIFRVRLN